MNELISNLGFSKIKGDKTLWGIIIIISLLSVFPVYSASSNLEYIAGEGTTLGHVFKHLGVTAFGIGLMWFVQLIRYEYLAKICSYLLLFLFIPILAYTSFFGGQVIDGASASRWIKIPVIGMSFQPSSFTYILLIVYLCRYIARNSDKDFPWWKHALYVFGPIILVFLLVAKDNGSTAIMIMASSIIVLILGGFAWRYIIGFVSIAVLIVSIFLLIAMKTSWIQNNRVDTWKSRIEVYIGNKQEGNGAAMNSKENYQITQATAALVHGGIRGKGPGKSAMKQMLPQSVSDFIFAIIVEEYGTIGATILLFLYLIILFRIVTIANKVPGFIAPLMVLSMGVILFIQIIVNIAVTLSLIPVTGQPLPLISYGGSAMLSTYFLLGIILNVSKGAQILNEEGLTPQQTLQEINDIA